jgi:hypothetical protein
MLPVAGSTETQAQAQAQAQKKDMGGITCSGKLH